MPQGIGYPSTTLAGEGGRPAMDAATNTPLTIEMLLARRGLMGYGGNHNLQQMMARQNAMGQQSGAGGGTVDDSGRVVTRSGGVGPASIGGVTDPSMQSSATVDPTTGLDTSETEELQEASMLDMLAPAAGVGAAAGAGYYIGQALRRINNRRMAQGMPPVDESAVTMNNSLVEISPQSSMQQPMLTDGRAQQMMIGQEQQGLLTGPDVIAGQAPETQRALTDRKAPAKARANRAAAGQPNDVDTIPLRQRLPGSMEPYAVADELRNRGMSIRGNTRGPAGSVDGERLDGVNRATSRRIPRVRP